MIAALLEATSISTLQRLCAGPSIVASGNVWQIRIFFGKRRAIWS